MPNLDDFPESSEPEWVKVKGIVYKLHDTGYRVHEPDKAADKPKGKRERGGLEFGS